MVHALQKRSGLAALDAPMDHGAFTRRRLHAANEPVDGRIFHVAGVFAVDVRVRRFRAPARFGRLNVPLFLNRFELPVAVFVLSR